MPRRRIQADSGLRTPIVTPTTVARDPFTTGEATGTLRLGQRLAQGLSTFNDELTSLSTALFTDRKERQFKEGQRKAQDELLSQNADEAAIKNQELPASESKWFWQGYKSKVGQQAAHGVQTRFEARLARDNKAEIIHTDDELLEIYAEVKATYFSEQDIQFSDEKAFKNGFNDTSVAMLNGSRVNYARQKGAEIETNDVKLYGSNTYENLGTIDREGVSATELGEQLTAENDELHSHLTNTNAYNDQLVDAILDRYREDGDEYWIDLLKEIKAGKSDQAKRPSFSATYRDDIRAARREFAGNAQAKATIAAAADRIKFEAPRQEAKDNLITLFNSETLTEDNVRAISEALRLSGDIDGSDDVITLGYNLLTKEQKDNPTTIALLEFGIDIEDTGDENYVKLSRLQRLVDSNDLSVSSYVHYRELIEKRDQGILDRVTKTSYYDEGIEDIDLVHDLIGFGRPTDEEIQARRDISRSFDDQMRVWASDPKHKFDKNDREAGRKEADRILTGLYARFNTVEGLQGNYDDILASRAQNRSPGTKQLTPRETVGQRDFTKGPVPGWAEIRTALNSTSPLSSGQIRALKRAGFDSELATQDEFVELMEIQQSFVTQARQAITGFAPDTGPQLDLP